MKSYFKLETNQLILRLSAAIHTVYGLCLIIFPLQLQQTLKMQQPVYPELWQVLGIFYLVFGVGFFIASHDSAKHWPIVLLGFMAKLLITLGLITPILENKFSLALGLVVLISDIVWLVPFYFILESAYDEHTVEDDSPKSFNELQSYVRTSEGKTLAETSHQENVLLVFIRQFGCLFCRENVTEMSKFQNVINDKKLKLVFVHMGDPAYADEFFSKYFDHPVAHISDPGRHLYKSLNLKRGTFFQLFGPMTWLRGFWVTFIKGIFQGRTEGDPLQLGGIFILSRGQIVYEQKIPRASTLFQLTSIP